MSALPGQPGSPRPASLGPGCSDISKHLLSGPRVSLPQTCWPHPAPRTPSSQPGVLREAGELPGDPAGRTWAPAEDSPPLQAPRTSGSRWKTTTRPPLSPVASSSPVWLNSTVEMTSAGGRGETGRRGSLGPSPVPFNSSGPTSPHPEALHPKGGPPPDSRSLRGGETAAPSSPLATEQSPVPSVSFLPPASSPAAPSRSSLGVPSCARR